MYTFSPISGFVLHHLPIFSINLYISPYMFVQFTFIESFTLPSYFDALHVMDAPDLKCSLFMQHDEIFLTEQIFTSIALKFTTTVNI